MKEYLTRLTWVDYLAILAVLRGFYVGYRSGLFPEVLRIAAYLFAAIVTLQFYAMLAEYLTLNTPLNAGTARVVAILGLLTVSFALAKFITWILQNLLKIGDGGFFYRLLGMTLGGARWILLLSFLFMLIDQTPIATLKTDIDKRSLSGPEIKRLAPILFDFLSGLSPQLAVPRVKSAP